MASRRRQSSQHIDRPVQFYKFIALTFLTLTIILLGVIVFMSTKQAYITVTTKPSPVDISTVVTFGDNDVAKKIKHVVVKESFPYTKHFQPTGSKKTEGLATGFVTLHNTSGVKQPLVKTTRLLTREGVLFRLKKGVTVPAHDTLEQVEVYADQEGGASDIGPSNFSIPGLRENRQKEVYASSEESMSGGLRTVGVVSDDDIEQARETIRALAEKQAKESFAKEYPELEGLYSVVSLTTSGNVPEGKEVDGFTLEANVEVVGGFYNKDDMRSWAGLQLAKKALDDGEVVRPNDQTDPIVAFDSYDENTNNATVSVFYDGTVTLSPEHMDLDKTMFFGKTRDEVRRYVISLDHVHNVDVRFQPAWMQHIPHVHDNIQIVVKEIE